MDIEYCICCERNLRISQKTLYCKVCDYIYYIDTDVTPLNEYEIFIDEEYKPFSYPIIFKSPERVFRCCKFIGYTSNCCDLLENLEINENEPSHKFGKEPIYFNTELMNCLYGLEGCYTGSNTLYWKNSRNEIIKQIIS